MLEVVMDNDASISAKFPFESRYLEVEGSQIHYVDEGAGDPVLFLHGNPASSYLWRNIIPHLSDRYRCIAPDLVGMGKSDKPDIRYGFFDHFRYVEGFIEGLHLKNITFVIHDWGSALGFHYASRNEANIKAMAFFEAIIKPARWKDFPPDFKMGFKMFRAPIIGWLLIAVMNAFINKLLPEAVVRPLTEEEMGHYREPFPSIRSRRPVHRWPNEIPIDGKPADVHQAVTNFSRWLTQTELPKLLFHADPGGIVREKQIDWCRTNMKNLSVIDIGPGVHYLQEDNPHLIGEELRKWLDRLAVSGTT